MGLLRRLWRNRKLLEPFLDLLQQVVKSAQTLAEIRKALAEGIEAGQLDDALQRFVDANERADQYIKTGR